MAERRGDEMYTHAGGNVKDANLSLGDNKIINGDLSAQGQGADHSMLMALGAGALAAGRGFGGFLEKFKTYRNYKESFNNAKESAVNKVKNMRENAWKKVIGDRGAVEGAVEETGTVTEEANAFSKLKNVFNKGAGETLAEVEKTGAAVGKGAAGTAEVAAKGAGVTAEAGVGIVSKTVGRLALPVAAVAVGYGAYKELGENDKNYQGRKKDDEYAAKQGEIIGKATGSLTGGVIGGALLAELGPVGVIGGGIAGAWVGDKIGGLVGKISGEGVGLIAYGKSEKALEDTKRIALDKNNIGKSWTDAREQSGLPKVAAAGNVTYPGLSDSADIKKNFDAGIKGSVGAMTPDPGAEKTAISLKRGIAATQTKTGVTKGAEL